MGSSPFIVGLGGATHPVSSNEGLVRAVLARAEQAGARTRMFDGPHLAKLPHYAPQEGSRTPEQREFVEAVRASDALVIGTPGYHGGVSGLVKNAIDLLEDLRDDARPYMDGRPVGLVVTAGGWQACGVTLAALRSIVHAMRGWPTPMGIAVNTSAQPPFDAAGELAPGPARDAVALMARQVMSVIRPSTASSDF